jgi:bacillithiol system protein YtxJ
MWKSLSERNLLQEIRDVSRERPVLIFKHSTRCGVSSMAKNRLERYWTDQDTEKIEPYLLDLIRYRDISRSIEETFGVHHESPQVLLIKNGECIYNASHMGIDYQNIIQQVGT